MPSSLPTSSTRPRLAAAQDLAGVDRHAHVATKLRVRQRVLDELRSAIETELV